MTTHEFAALLLSDTPDLPFNFGTGIKLLDRSASLKGPFTFREEKGVLIIDQSPDMGYTEAEQKEVFDLCLDKKNWKNPVNIDIDEDVVERLTQVKIYRILTDQIGDVTITHYPKKRIYRITAPGYYESIGS